MKESEGTEEITTFTLYPYLLQEQQALPNYKPMSVGRLGDKSYRTPSPHPTTPTTEGLPLKCQENLHLKMTSVYVVC